MVSTESFWLLGDIFGYYLRVFIAVKRHRNHDKFYEENVSWVGLLTAPNVHSIILWEEVE